jgi:hypothetical protein
MTASADVDVTCAVFRRLPPAALAPEAIHRFIVGEDPAPRRLTAEEASRELGDPFAVLLLLRGSFHGPQVKCWPRWTGRLPRPTRSAAR